MLFFYIKYVEVTNHKITHQRIRCFRYLIQGPCNRVHKTHPSGNLCYTEKCLCCVSEQTLRNLIKTIKIIFLISIIFEMFDHKKAVQHIFEAKSYFLPDVGLWGM